MTTTISTTTTAIVANAQAATRGLADAKELVFFIEDEIKRNNEDQLRVARGLDSLFLLVTEAKQGGLKSELKGFKARINSAKAERTSLLQEEVVLQNHLEIAKSNLASLEAKEAAKAAIAEHHTAPQPAAPVKASVVRRLTPGMAQSDVFAEVCAIRSLWNASGKKVAFADYAAQSVDLRSAGHVTISLFEKMVKNYDAIRNFLAAVTANQKNASRALALKSALMKVK